MAKQDLAAVCRSCGQPFIPNRRNRSRQKFCSKPECRKASKAESQRRWLEKNPGHFCGHEHAERIQEWRQRHQKRLRAPSPEKSASASATTAAGRRTLPAKTRKTGSGTPSSRDLFHMLQDLIICNPLIVGLIEHVFGCVLQDDFEEAISLLLRKAAAARRRILGVSAQRRASSHEVNQHH